MPELHDRLPMQHVRKQVTDLAQIHFRIAERLGLFRERQLEIHTESRATTFVNDNVIHSIDDLLLVDPGSPVASH